MKLALLLLTLGPLFAAVEEQFTTIGTIDKIAHNQVTVKTARGSFPISANDKTEVVKDKTYHDLSPLKVSDEISIRSQPDAAGKLVAVKIFANVVNFAGTVKDVGREEIEVITNSGDERKIVRIYPDTVFGTNRSDVTAGKHVRVVGLDVGNGAVDAARIALYNTDVPTDRGIRK
jgi:hypothetical protein